MDRRERRLRGFVILAVATSMLTLIALFAYSFSTQREDLIDSLTRLDPLVFLIAIGLHLGALGFWAVRLMLLADGCGHPLAFRRAMSGVLASVFVAALTPARLGGEPVRFAVLTSAGTPPREASLMGLLERALDNALFIVLGTVATSVLLPQLPEAALLGVVLPLGILFLVLLIVFPLLVLFKPRVLHPFMHLAKRFVGEERLEHAKERVVLEGGRFRRALGTVLARKPSRVPLAALATTLSWALEFGVIAYLLYAFGHDVPFTYVALGAVIVVLLTTLPLLPGGSGLAELGALGIFSPVAPGLTPAFVLVWRVTTYYVDTIVGGLFAVRFAGAETRRVLTRKRRPDEVARAVVEGDRP